MSRILARAGYFTKRALIMELHVWASLYRFILRRPRVPTGATAFTYHRPIIQILMIFVILSAFELVIVDLIVHRWIAVRVPLLILGIWGLTWMLGFVFGYLTRPHAVGSQGVRVRQGAEIDIPIGWDEIASVALLKDVEDAKAPQVTTDENGATLHLRIQNETNIEIELERPTAVRLPRGTVEVRRVRIFADEPRQYMDAVRQHLNEATR